MGPPGLIDGGVGPPGPMDGPDGGGPPGPPGSPPPKSGGLGISVSGVLDESGALMLGPESGELMLGPVSVVLELSGEVPVSVELLVEPPESVPVESA
ncbi:hypothetical protein [Nocardia alni]|uniref:hypothetical protein n=1 Tax=Nocardia alni TaxID=2815723 RepID=UPI001C22C3B1|nr:hypothetical protein [Nocardia alni]